jgi:hypothetical protein
MDNLRGIGGVLSWLAHRQGLELASMPEHDVRESE